MNTLMPGAINTPGCGPAGPVVCCHDSVCCQHAAQHGHGLLHSTSCLLHSAVLLMAGVCSPTSPLQCGNDVTSLTLQLPVCILPELPPTLNRRNPPGAGMHQQVKAESEKTVNDDLTIGHVCARTADSRGSPSRPAPSCEILRDRADNSVVTIR